MSRPDIADMHANGTLPRDPFDASEPYDSAPRSEPRRGRTIDFVDAGVIAAPLPELAYLVPALGIASGAPVLCAGYGYAGKTVSLQSAALSIATGKPLWGVYGVRAGRVRHLDFEQGSRVTHERYQRLAVGMGVDLRALGDRLAVAVNPAVHLDARDAADAYARAFEGVDFAIVDSLRAAAPTYEENSSEVRRALDLASRAAEKQGTVVAFIHHARKPKEGDTEGSRYSIRGSGAIFDAAASVFVFSGEKGQPTRVTHEKCRNTGKELAPFGLRIEDVERDGNPRAGLQVVHMEAEQLAAMREAKSAGRPSGHSAAMERVLGFLAGQGGEYRGSKTSLRASLAMNRDKALAAVDQLESEGRVRVGKDERGAFVAVVTPGPESSRVVPGLDGTP